MSRRRLALLSAAAVAVSGIVAAGVVLAGGRDDAAQAVAVEPTDAVSAQPASSGTVPPEPGPAAVEADGVDPVTGEQVSLADYEGTPVVLNFWASWCSPCREEIPALVELAERHPEIALVGVNFQDAASSARALQRELGFEFPSIGDPDGNLGAELGIQGMPTTYLLDAEHRIAGVIVGGTDLAGFERGLELIVP